MPRFAGARWRAVIGIVFAAGSEPVQALPAIVSAIPIGIPCCNARASARA